MPICSLEEANQFQFMSRRSSECSQNLANSFAAIRSSSPEYSRALKAASHCTIFQSQTATTIQSNRDRIVGTLTLHDFATIPSRLNFNFRRSKSTCFIMTRTITTRKTNVTIRLSGNFAFSDEKQLKFPMTIEAKNPRNREPIANYLTLHDFLRFSHDKIKLVKCSREWS